jgi:hypothetical protein
LHQLGTFCAVATIASITFRSTDVSKNPRHENRRSMIVFKTWMSVI